MKKSALVLLAEGFEEIEAVSAIDVLRRAEVDVKITGVGAGVIKGAHGVVIKTDNELGAYKELPDVLVIPGGMPGVNNLAASEAVGALIKEVYKKGKIVAAICAAPSYVLAPTGVIRGKKVTCYPGCEDLLKGKAEFADKKVVVDGNIITSKGPGTAIDFALEIVEMLLGKNVKEEVRKRVIHG